MTMSLPAALTERIGSIVRKKEESIQYGPIAIDLGPNGLRMAQFRKNGKLIELAASAYISNNDVELVSSSQLRALIKQIFKENDFVGRKVVSCMQPEDVKIMMLSFMRHADKTDEELIVQRIAERIDNSIEDYVIDFMMVRPKAASSQERSVLVALSRHDEVVNYLEYLRKAGLSVQVLEIEPTAVRRLISVKHADEHHTNLMVLSMGCTQTYITVLSGRRLIYERDIDFGEEQLIAMLCKELDIDEHEARAMLERENAVVVKDAGAEQDTQLTDAFYSVLKPLFMELVEEINRALIYAASETRGAAVKHVYLTDRVATWHGIESFINTLIEVPVSVLLPNEGFKNADILTANSGPRSAVVTGMALHGLTEYG